MGRLTRRSLLGFGALAGVGGVIGTAPSAAAAPTGRSFTLTGRSMRRLGAAGTAVGDVHSVRGALSAGGATDGEVFHTAHVVARSGSAADVATVESHLFVFEVGTLAGSGTVDHAGRGTFVVTGGTGRYAGARGSYTTQQSSDASGGGTAHYTFALTTEI